MSQTSPPPRPRITVITPCYNEALNLEACHQAVKEVFETRLPDCQREHLFADNASTDGSREMLRRLAESDPCVKVIVNARNFGPFRSTFNALMSASGDAVVVLMAADLQDPPEMIAQFVERWKQGAKIVYGIRANREEGIVLRNVRKLYYRAVTLMADIRIPPDVSEFQLVDRRIVETLRQCDDHYPYIRGMIANCGYYCEAEGIPYVWKKRARGFSKNRLYHLIDQALNGLISFTNLPMRLCMGVGFGLSGLSLLYGLFALVMHLFFPHLTERGIPMLIVSQLFFFGVLFFFLGVIGEYVASIHTQVRKRPMVVERERYNLSPPPGPCGVDGMGGTCPWRVQGGAPLPSGPPGGPPTTPPSAPDPTT
ncbi:MAG: glycosyltransferase family 2 protein [Magnetococcales bacterium]|nr:glycosyltransferase family 2 protein [Magnetococcales bacterium]